MAVRCRVSDGSRIQGHGVEDIGRQEHRTWNTGQECKMREVW